MSGDLLELTVSEVRPLTSHVTAFRLRRPDGAALPGYLAGAHIKVRVEIDGEAAWRHYSLIRHDQASDAAEYLIAVRREDRDRGGRGGSLFMHTQVKPGDKLQVSSPINGFGLDPAHDDVLLIAGGIGITPLVSMAAALRAEGKSYALHYTGRSLDQLALVPELQAGVADALTLYADDDEDLARRLDLRRLLAGCKPSQALYTCGPKGMIDAVRDLALELGWHIDQLHYELFVEAAAEAGDRGFEVELTQSGTRLQVAAGQTILDAMIEAGLDPMFDCKRGECGVCAVPVLSGAIEHRDNCLSASERAAGKVIQICISRAKGNRLVLDA
jgi:ferredoxin-NADP reductase